MDRQMVISAVISVVLFVVMAAALAPVNWSAIGNAVADTSDIAAQMFSPSGYGLTLLVVAVLLGASMVGGVYLAKEESK